MGLKERTQQLVEEVPHNVRQLCRDTGLTERWYYAFKASQTPNPGVDHVQTLHDYLAGLAAGQSQGTAPAETK